MIKRVVAGGSGLSILGTAIYLITNHISEVQYNNWGNGVWNGLLAIQSDGNCSGSSADEKYYKACIKKDINDYYNLENMWNSDYWKSWYLKVQVDTKTHGNTQNNFLKLGSWEKFREVCTKGIDEMIRKKEWSKLFNALGYSSSGSNTVLDSNITYEECWKAKTYVQK